MNMEPSEEDVRAAKELLEKADASFDKEGWCSGSLTNSDGNHCSLGAIGYARWGQAYDELVRYGNLIPGAKGIDGYSVLVQDAQTRAAVRLLAEQLGTRVTVRSDPQLQARYDLNDIFHYNDSRSKRDVRRLFGGAIQRLKDMVLSLVPKKLRKEPVQPEVRVEYIPADDVALNVKEAAKETA